LLHRKLTTIVSPWAVVALMTSPEAAHFGHVLSTCPAADDMAVLASKSLLRIESKKN
jgi:hypothetical protein